MTVEISEITDISEVEPNVLPSTMFVRDNLEIMRGIDSECIDLIYLDPPFNSKHNYAAPIGSEAAGAEFKDMWSLDDVDAQWIELIVKDHPDLHAILKAVPDDSDKSYLVYMAVRLLEMHRILKLTGSIYLHCDPTMNAWLRIVCDCIFGKRNFRNEIVWHYSNLSATRRYFPKKHDTILFFSKSDAWTFNDKAVRIAYSESSNDRVKYKGSGFAKNAKGSWIHPDGKIPDSVWDIPLLKGNEREGYPTQKPLKLVHRIIVASSNKGDWVLDPFCGCATTCVAAHFLERKWIGIDISPAADILVRRRIDKETRNDWVSSGVAVYEPPPSRTDIPIRSGKQVDPRAYKKILYGKQGGYCNLCRTHFQPRNLTIDHIIPKSKGGQDLEGNLQLLCQACNSSKGARAMAEMKAMFSTYAPTPHTYEL